MTLSKADAVLKEIERMTERKFLPIVGPCKGGVLVEMIHKINPVRILEVGALIGYSAILMGKGPKNDAHLIAIEIHAVEARMALENIEKAHLAPTIDVVVGDVTEVISRLTGKFDMVFIDADKTECLDYLRLAEDKLHKGSVVVADNAGVFADQMKDYLDYVRSSGKYSSEYVPVGEDGLEVSVKL
jgi:predicted O-methyltransferase YrrM